ncbi:maternal protein tudor isoform X3 [Pseudomyrmex gracilis]|uniref:maternal protein tudor isoform X3 n=1 Tax=Pseudomyrmex gracilis TaxID=219809 RepID=UPI0009951E8F|nr:maternal protein tudor isoform X3 [Pseudomyrmex gracilis]
MQTPSEAFLFVTHIEPDNVFLKIWGQTDKRTAGEVERLINSLLPHFNQGYGCPLKVTKSIVSEVCCAKFQNEGYYRATILDIRSDGMILVYFIDYGNTEVVLPHEVHLLSGIPGAEHLKAIPPMATEFVLSNVLPKNGIWDNEMISTIKSYLCYNEYKISIYVVNNRYLIQLWFNNEDFSKVLVNDNMALPATIQDMFSMQHRLPQVAMQPSLQVSQQPQMAAYQQRNKGNMNTMIPMTQNQNINPNINAQALIHKTSSGVNYQKYTEPQEALVFKSRVLNVDTKYEVCVSHVEDGPQKFSVQVKSTVATLQQLMDDIQRHPKKPLVEPPLPGSVCLGVYSDGNVLCRAVVMSVMEDKCKLYYVDFGHTAVLSYSDIFQLPPEYINPKVLSIRFALSGLNELHITPELKEYFKQLVSRKLLVLHVRPPEGPPLIQYGDLYDNGVNVKDILKRTFPKPNHQTVSPSFTYLRLPQLMKDTYDMVSVPYIESCKKFFVQLQSGLQSLDSISEALHKYVKTAPSLRTLKVGLPCAALYKSQWYRAEITNIDGNNIKVFYVDYGNEEELSVMSLRTIHPDLMKLPAQAIKCALDGYETLAEDSDVTSHFERLVLEKQVYMKVVAAQPEGLLVELFDNSTKPIHSQLLDNLFCDKTTENSHDTGFCDKNENSPTKSQNGEIQQSTIPVNGFHSEDTNRYKKKFTDFNTFQDNKSNNWKDEWSSEKKHDNKYERNTYSSRDKSQNDRFIRDEGQNRFGKNRPYNRRDRNEINTFNRDGRGPPRGTDENRFSNYGHRHNRSNSDKDSDSSGKSSGKHERGFNRGFRREENRNSGERWNDSQTTKDWTDKGAAIKNKPYKYRNERFNGNEYNNSNNDFKIREDNVTNLSSVQLNTEEWDTNDINKELQSNVLLGTTVVQFPSLDITLGSVKKCVVSHANNPSDFFVNLQCNSNLIKMMENDIRNIYTDGGEIMQTFEIQCDKCCVALDSECCRWGRAIITSVEKNNAIVKFVDSGKILSVDFAKIKVIREEFLNLPIQAIHCKMLGAPNTFSNEQTASFMEKVGRNIKGLEMEFIAEENKLYQVLIYDVVENGKPCNYINEQFWAENMDLTKAKQIAPNQKAFEIITRSLQAKSNYVPFDSKWRTEFYEAGSKYDITVSWFINPNKFYCQLLNKENEFKVMMKEIQTAYPDKKHSGGNIEVGSIVIARFPEDRALYRAEVMNKDPLDTYIVHYVDFGNYASVSLSDLYPVKEKFMELPKMAVECSLKDVALDTAKFSSWSDVDINALDDCFNADKYECTFHNLRDNQYLISLFYNGQSVADTLVQRCLAISAPQDFTKTNKVTDIFTTEVSAVPTVDINLLPGQTLRVKISSVDNAAQFYVQLPTASKCDEIVNKYMDNNEVLGLPGELTSMQNQALKCSLHGVSTSFEADEKLKNLEGQDVLVHVEEVNDNRLFVKLYDLLGHGIINTKDNNEKISPICSLPILTSTCQVFLSYADHDSNLWVRRFMDNDIEIKLCQDLNEYYNNNSAQTLKPEEHLLCAVNQTNNQWQRGRIVSYNETTAYVLLIDYGIITEVTLDSLKVLESQFYEPYQLTVHASLPVALIGSQSEQADMLHLHLKDKTLTANFYNINKNWIVELIENGEKISDRFCSLNIAKERTSDLSSQTHDPLASKFDVYVSHIDSPSQFWLQKIDESTLLNKKLDQLQLDVSGFPAIDGVPEVGTYCAAVYDADGLWYYAEVLDADEDITTVRFIDYGNTDVISNNTNKIRQLPDSHKNLEILAIKCRLDVIPIDTEDWSDSIYDKFLNLIQSAQSIQALILADTTPKRVDLLLDGKSVSETLVEETLAIRINTEQEPVDEIIELELDPHSAFVSHLNSPSEFWIQEEKSVADLEVMADRFLVADMFSKVTEAEEGLLCVAKYPEDDQWYRARIVSHNEDGTQVIYIDYGNSSISTDIRAIPEDLAVIPPLSRKCCLELPPQIKEWSEQACEEFVKLAADGATIFHLEILKEQETSVIKLTIDGQNVADILALKCEQLPVIEERLPPLGEENLPNVVLSYIYSPDEFWIQAESDINELEVMSDRLGNAESFLTLNNPAIGTVCAAIYPEDGYWYRAKIIERDENADNTSAATKVLYIDYGNCSVTEELRVLPEDIVNIPALSKRCTLEKPSHIISWSTKASEKFKELAAEGNTMFQFESLDEGDPMRVRLSLNGTNVVELLLAEGENIPEINEKIETDDKNFTSDTLEQQETVFDHQQTSEDKEIITQVEQQTFSQTDEMNVSNLDNINQNLENFEINNDNETFESMEYTDINSEITTPTKDISSIAETNEDLNIINDERVQDPSEAIPIESSVETASTSVSKFDEITENTIKDTISDLESQKNDTNLIVKDKMQSDVNEQAPILETNVFSAECKNIPEVGEKAETDGRNIISDTTEQTKTIFHPHSTTSEETETNKDLDITSDETVQDMSEKISRLKVSSSVRTELSVDEIIENMIKDPEPQTSDANLSNIENKMQLCEIAQSDANQQQELLAQTHVNEPSTDARDVKIIDLDSEKKISELNKSQSSLNENQKEQDVHPSSPKMQVAEITCSSEQDLTREDTVSKSSQKTDDLESQPDSTDNKSSTSGYTSIVTTTKPLDKIISLIADSAKKCSDYTRKVLEEEDIEEKCVSGNESPKSETTVELQSWTPSTPKTPHSEKLVAAVVNPVIDSDSSNEDEILTISTENDIPKHAV